MKKLFALVLTLCLLAGLMAVTASAEATAVKVKFENSTAADFSLTVEPGATAYVTSDDAKQFIKWTETEAPTDKFIKLELSADGATVNVTMKNIDIDSSGTAYTSHAIEFPAGEYAVVLNLEGESTMLEQNSASIKYNNDGGMTITGDGTLNLKQNGSASGAIWANGGDMLIKNTKVNFTVTPGNNSKHHAIYSCKNDVIFEGSKINLQIEGGSLAYLGNGAAKVGRYTLDTSTDRFITVKDCDITASCKSAVFASVNPATISNTTMKITKNTSSNVIFEPAPKFEGDFSAIAGLAKNAEKLDKLKVYDEKKLGSYTYFYMVPGIVELLPTEPEVTVPEVTTPEETTPEVTTPEATTPEATTPEATTPVATTPNNNNNSGNNATTPDETNPATTAPAAEDEAEEEGGNALTVILIILVVMIVAAGGTFGVILYLKKKKG